MSDSSNGGFPDVMSKYFLALGRQKLLVWSGLGFLAILIVFFYTRLFALYPLNSDEANALLSAVDMAAGNWRLKDWILSPDNYWGLDLSLMAAIWPLTKNAVLTLRLAPAIAWLALGAAAFVVAGQRPRAGAIFILAAVLFVPAFVANGATFFTGAPIHVLTAACILGAIAMAERLLLSGRPRPLLLLVYCLVVVDAAASDPEFIVLGVLPTLLALFLGEAQPGAPRIRLALCTIAAALAGKMLIALNANTGGFVAMPTDFSFREVAKLSHSIGIIAASILNVLGCNVFGLRADTAIVQVVRLPLLLLLGIPLWRTGVRLASALQTREIRPPVFAETALYFVVFADLAAMVVSNAVVDAESIRYILPAWAGAAALAARSLRLDLGGKMYCAVVAMLAFGIDLRLVLPVSPPPYLPVDESIAACLERAGLTYGYGTYWQASIVTIASRGAVAVRAVETTATGQVQPQLWLSSTAWYRPFPRRPVFFVVTLPDDRMVPPHSVEAAFGRPDSVITLDAAIIDVYGRHVPAETCAETRARAK